MSSRKPRAKKAPATEPTQTDILAYKGFDAGLACRGYQYEIGKTFTHDGKVVRCASGGFHSCEMPLDVWNYYGPVTSRFADVLVGGAIDRPTSDDPDTKIASARITIRAELKLPDLVRRAVEWIIAKAGQNVTTGNSSHAASTGDYSHAASTGNYSHAASTGYRSHAASTGNSSHAASTGCRSHAASTGNYSHAASTGNYSHAEALGKNAIAVSVGVNATAKANEHGWIVLASYGEWDGNEYPLLMVKTAKVGGPEGVQAGVTYRLDRDGAFVETEPAC